MIFGGTSFSGAPLGGTPNPVVAAALVESDNVVAATGALAIKGVAALTESDDGAAATGLLLIQGTASLTEADDEISAAAVVLITGLADTTEADDYIAFTGRVPLEWLDALATAHDVPNRTLCAVCARSVLPEEMHRQVRRIAQRLVWTGLYTCRTCVDIPGDPPPIHRHADPRPVPNARPSRS